MSKNFQVLIAFVENNEMSFVSSSRVENLNERRRDKENTSLPLILLDADRLRWSLLSSERVVVRSDFVRGLIYPRYLRFHECRPYTYAHPAQRRGSPGLKRGIGNAVRARMHVCTHTHARVCMLSHVCPSVVFPRISSVASSRNAHAVSRYAFRVRSNSRGRFDGQMALKSVYNSSRSSAPDETLK